MADENSQKAKPSALNIVLSACAAAFGVQSNKNRERDFEGGNIYHYIVAGIIFTACFIAAVAFIVNTVLKNVGT